MKVNMWNRLKIWLTRQLWKKQYPTKEDWKRVNQLDWDKIATQANPELINQPLKQGAYTRSYRSFSGCDTKLYYTDLEGKIHYLPETQGFSFCWTRAKDGKPGSKMGTLITVMFDESLIPKLEKIQNIYLLAADEYSAIAQADFIGAKLEETVYGISTDDIITEEIHTLSFGEIYPFRRVEENIAMRKHQQEG